MPNPTTSKNPDRNHYDRRAQPHIYVVNIGDADTQTARQLGRLNQPDHGTVAVTIRPGMRPRIQWLAKDLLAALGVRHDVTGKGRNQHDDWEYALTWYATRPLHNLVVIDAHLLPAKILPDLVSFAALQQLDLWLVTQHPDDNWREQTDHWPTQTAALEQLKTLATPQDPDTPESGNDDLHDDTEEQQGRDETLFDLLPHSDFPTFLHDCKRLLPEDTYEQIEDRYRHHFENAQTLFPPNNNDKDGGDDEVTERQVADLLREQLAECPTTEAMTVCIRATQAAAFLSGWHLQVDLAWFLGVAGDLSLAAAKNPQTWRRLAAYRQPYRPAACALAAAGLDINQMLDLAVADIDPDTATMTTTSLNGKTLTVQAPEHAAIYLKAQQTQRYAEGANPTDPYLARNDDPYGPRALVGAITDPLLEVGVAVTSKRIERRNPEPNKWMRRLGISIQPLT